MKKMKSFQSLSATLLLTIALIACSNDASTKEATGGSDTTAPASTTETAADVNRETPEANKKLVRDFIQALYGDKDSTAIDKYIADNLKTHNPLLPDGKEQLKKWIAPLFRKSKYSQDKSRHQTNYC
jgi:hypothetical protein